MTLRDLPTFLVHEANGNLPKPNKSKHDRHTTFTVSVWQYYKWHY